VTHSLGHSEASLLGHGAALLGGDGPGRGGALLDRDINTNLCWNIVAVLRRDGTTGLAGNGVALGPGDTLTLLPLMDDGDVQTPLGRGGAALVLHTRMTHLLGNLVTLLAGDLMTLLHWDLVTVLPGHVVALRLLVGVVSITDFLLHSLALLLVRSAALLV